MLVSILGFIVLSAIAGGTRREKQQHEKSRDTIQGAKGADPWAPSQQTEKRAAKREAIEVTAEKLSADYKANEVRADDIYKDKVLRVTGAVNSIGKDILDNPYIVLRASGDFWEFTLNSMMTRAILLLVSPRETKS